MRIGLASLGLVLLLVAGPAHADGYDETEYRLKTAGIDEDLRERIHAAIRRGVAHLRKFQKPDGSFGGNPGHTALAGLALRHAAIPDGVEGGRAAIRWLEKAGRSQHSMTTYGVGLLAMLLTADGSHEAWNKSLHDRLARGPRKDKGYWGYQPAGGRGSNLSTAQFGCLGLWAGERAGAPTATKTWRLHLDALLLAQQPDGSWSYNPGRPAGRKHDVSRGYPTGTYMGLAGLALASAALHEEFRKDAKRWSRTLVANSVARAALRRHVAWEFDSVILPVTFGNFFPYYRLYAIEKACIFLDLEDVAGRRWYEEGARRLLAAQAANGSWSSGAPAAWGLAAADQGAPVDTSFALLFLLRASHAYHPITPRPVDRPTAVITPGDDPLETEAKVVTGPPPPSMSLETANGVLDELDTWLAEKKLTSPAHAIASFARIREIYGQFRPYGASHSTPHDTWCRRAESALLEASTRFLEARPRYREHWQAVGLLALDTLAATDRRGTPVLMRTIDRMPEHASFSGPVRFGWYSAAFDALRRLEAPALAAWIGQRMLSKERVAWPRTSAALTTLGGIRGLQGRQRHAAAKQILDWLTELHRRGGVDATMRDLQLDGLIAMRRLARAGTDQPPALESGSLAALVQSVTSWWRAHGADTDRAWAD